MYYYYSFASAALKEQSCTSSILIFSISFPIFSLLKHPFLCNSIYRLPFYKKLPPFSHPFYLIFLIFLFILTSSRLYSSSSFIVFLFLSPSFFLPQHPSLPSPPPISLQHFFFSFLELIPSLFFFPYPTSPLLT